ncbi:MAG TPA: hypothetical protein PKJ97_02345 [Candidatus Bilamarchaeaceae archaeon]|nr:hypothetical protein [Candidatus Bilamarchaeaceae archaeon]
MAGKPLYFSSVMKMVPVKENEAGKAAETGGAAERKKRAENR